MALRWEKNEDSQTGIDWRLIDTEVDDFRGRNQVGMVFAQSSDGGATFSLFSGVPRINQRPIRTGLSRSQAKQLIAKEKRGVKDFVEKQRAQGPGPITEMGQRFSGFGGLLT